MGRMRLAGVGTLLVLVVGVSAGVAPAATLPSATAAMSLATGSPAAIACDGSVDAKVTLTGTPGTAGAATDVMLVLDLSGSMNSPTSDFTDLENAAKDVLAALDAADGLIDQTIAGNRVGVVTYKNSAGSVAAALGSSYSTLFGVVSDLPTPTGSSPHDDGINAAAAALSASTNAKAMVLISDGQAAGGELTDSTAAANTAKAAGIRILPIGISSDVSSANLQTWASNASYYQSGSPGPVDRTKLVTDSGALVSVPVEFALTETAGSSFSLASLGATTGSVTPAAGPPSTLTWHGTLTNTLPVTLDFRATRNGNDVFSATTELVSTMAVTVSGGTATVSGSPSVSIDVLPCGGSLLAPPTECTGSACTATGTGGDGTKYTLNAGTPQTPTTAFLTGLNSAPPAGACPGFQASTTGVQFDIRPLTTDATFEMVIPKAALGSKKWWQANICFGTNMKFTTAIGSLANLRPGATLIGGGSLPGRYWGLLPSIPRYTFIQGLGWVPGPWITKRSHDPATGNAIVRFKIPYIAGSAGTPTFTTDGLAAYDPKLWG
jgi:Mg-chelatase subunit ChlD